MFAEAETTGIQAPLSFPEPVGDPKDRLDFGFTFDQRFNQYFTHFHNMPIPADYSARADG